MRSGSGRPAVSRAASSASSPIAARGERAPRHLRRQAADGAGQFIAAAVVDGDGQVQSLAMAGEGLELLHERAQARRDPMAHADEPHPYVVAAQAVHLAEDVGAEDAHQPLDLVERALPVLGREGVERQVGDAEVGAGPDDLGHPPGAAGMAGDAVHATGGGPAAVAVHDDPDVKGRDVVLLHMSHLPVRLITHSQRCRQQAACSRVGEIGGLPPFSAGGKGAERRGGRDSRKSPVPRRW